MAVPTSAPSCPSAAVGTVATFLVDDNQYGQPNCFEALIPRPAKGHNTQNRAEQNLDSAELAGSLILNE